MKRLVILMLCAATVATASADGMGVIMKAYKSSKEYHAIEVGGPIKVFVEQREEGNIILRGSERALENIRLTVEDGCLSICFEKEFHIRNRDEMIQAEVYMPNNGQLRDFTAAACGVIDVKPQIVAKQVDIEVAAASKIALSKVVAEQVTVDAMGAAKASLEAECKRAEVEVAGASKVDISGSCERAEVEVMGASSVSAEQFHCKSLDAEISGASKASLKGDSAKVAVMGASKTTIECNEQLRASSSGASTLHYTGDCIVSIENNSGASTIKRR